LAFHQVYGIFVQPVFLPTFPFLNMIGKKKHGAFSEREAFLLALSQPGTGFLTIIRSASMANYLVN
jgi:hypothetical protein